MTDPTHPPDQDRMMPRRVDREAARFAEEALLAARHAWRANPSPENTAAYEAALDHALRLFDEVLGE